MHVRHSEPSIGGILLLGFIVCFLIFGFIASVFAVVSFVTDQKDVALAKENSKTVEEMTCRIIKFYPEISNNGFRTDYYCDVQNTDSGKYHRLKYPDFKIDGHSYVSSNFWDEVIQLEEGKIFTVKTVAGDTSYRYLVDIVE